jgi:hypothetical protein
MVIILVQSMYLHDNVNINLKLVADPVWHVACNPQLKKEKT